MEILNRISKTLMKNPLFLFVPFMLLSIGAIAQQPIEYGNNPEAGKYITLNFVKHYYEAYGDGKPLLLIHGNSTGTKGWAAQIEYFSKKFRVYSIDCRGRGKSDLGKDSLSYVQQAMDMAAFLDQMDLREVSIIGKSDGAIISLMMGIRFPERIQKIVAFSANLQPDSTAFYAESLKEIHEERIKAEKMLALKDTSKNWRIEQQRYRMMEFQPHISMDDLHRISIPVLVLSGDRDLIKTQHTVMIYQHIPNANLCILANEKHGLPRIHPALFNETVDRYLAEPFHNRAYRFEK
jgi:pimeloyl-ACP methyl ester carboxylesterase